MRIFGQDTGLVLMVSDVNFAILADLREANLSQADLREADLSEANLHRTHVTSVQLNQAKSLRGATLPDGTVHP